MEKEKKFSLRRFVSVMTLCTFAIIGGSGLSMLLSEGAPSPSGIMINWKEMHEIGCIFFVIFGVWHVILNFKVLCAYFKGNDKQFAFRMDWLIPVVLALVFFITVSLIPEERHQQPPGFDSGDFYKRSRGHGH